MADQGSNNLQCSSCKGRIKFIGNQSIRVGGTGGAAKLFFGEFAELGEGKWPLDFYQCEVCGHIEMFDKTQRPEVAK